MLKYWWQSYGRFAPTAENYPNPAEVLVHYRKLRGKSVAEVAEALQRSKDRIYKMESNGEGLNSVRSCQTLSTFLSIPPKLFGLDSLHKCQPEWWLAEGFPAFQSGSDGYPLPGEVIRHYRRQKWNSAPPKTRQEWSLKGLAEVLKLSESTIRQMEQSNHVDTITRRRILTSLLGIPPALLSLDSLKHPWPISLKTVNLGTEDIARHQQRLTRLWNGYFRDHGQNEQQVAITRISELSRTMPLISQRKELMAIQIIYYAYYADTLREQANFSQAISQLTLALERGKEIENNSIVAMLLLRRSSAHRGNGDDRAALLDIEQAQQLTTYTYTGLQQEIISSAGYMLSRLAQDATDITRSLKLFDQAGMIARKGQIEEDPYFLNANLGYYHLRRAKAYLVLSKRNKSFLSDAWNEIELARKLTPSYFTRRHALNNFTQAQVCFQSGEYPESTTLALDTLPVFKAIKSRSGLHSLAGLYRSLAQSNYKTSPFVARLGYELSTLILF